MENPRKKESMDSELTRGRVSKFYWWVAIRSRAWGLISLIVRTSICIMLANHDQNIEYRFKLAQNVFICKIGIE